MRAVLALVTGILVAIAVAGMPAAASNATIAATAQNTWSPSTATITAGESVTWTNGGGFHNVCVQKPGTSGDACDEYTNGDPATTWTSATHSFSTPGTYAFFCATHRSLGMTGTITVEAASTGTSTTPPDTMPTDTTTVPTQVEQNTVAGAPAFTGKIKRRASRKSLVLELGSSEKATLRATVFLRPPGGRSFARVSKASVHVKQGKNVVKVPRATLRRGAYRVKLQLVDADGNKSATKTLSFKIA